MSNNMLSVSIALVCVLTGTQAQRFRSPWIHDVNNLEAVAGYRTARLRWQYTYAPEPPAFRVQICELLPWLPKTSPRCRLRKLSLLPEVTPYVPANDDDHSGQPGSLDMLRKTPRGSYEALIGDLRLLTNYSVAVEPDFGSDSAANAIVYTGTQPREDDRRFQMVTTEFALMTTKGFSARAERCLANASRVVVSTGPFFGGKIAVEDAPEDGSCAVLGDPDSPKDAYTLDIDHKLCGSRLVNGSKMETNIIVHENRDIITHNTRRYLVVCSFLPDTYTITASVNLPVLRGKKKNYPATHTKVPGGLLLADPSPDPNEVFTYQRYKDSNVRDSRIAAEQRSSLTLENDEAGSHLTGNIALILLLATTALVGCGAALSWYATSGYHKRHEDHPKGTIGIYTAGSADPDPMTKEEQLELESSVVNFITIEGRPVALLPEATASEA